MTPDTLSLVTGSGGATVILAIIAYLGLVKRAIVPGITHEATLKQVEMLNAEADDLTKQNTELKVSLTRAETQLVAVRERLDEANAALKRLEGKADRQTRMIQDVRDEIGEIGETEGSADSAGSGGGA